MVRLDALSDRQILVVPYHPGNKYGTFLECCVYPLTRPLRLRVKAPAILVGSPGRGAARKKQEVLGLYRKRLLS